MFVLTNTQLNQAIIQGAVSIGAIDPESAKKLLAAPGTLRLTRTANGYVVLDQAGSAPNTNATTQVAPTTSRGPSRGRPPAAVKAAAAPGAAQTEDEGPPAANVKAALVASGMANPPGLNSINAWNATQRRQAIKWAKDPSKPRPEFIKERASRGSGASASTPPTASKTNVAPPAVSNGVEGGSGFEFFDAPDAGGATAQA